VYSNGVFSFVKLIKVHGFIDQFKANVDLMQTTFFLSLCRISVNSRDITIKQIRPIGRFGHYGFTYFRRIYCANIWASRLTSVACSHLF